MTICTAHDQEVCYESKDCPACELQSKIDALEEQIENLKADIDNLNSASE